MKFDKEIVLKHKFWLLLIVTLPLSLIAIFYLVTSVSGEISATNDAIKKDLTAFLKNHAIRKDSEIKEMEKAAKFEKSQEAVLWEQAFAHQEDLFLWPKEVEDKFNFRAGMFAQKIQILKGGENPKDDKNTIHGEVVEQLATSMKLKGADQKVHTIYPAFVVSIVGGDVQSFGKIEPGTHVAVTYNRGKYFNEELTNNELDTYKRPGVYESQIRPILLQVQPVNDKGDGVVQLGQWLYKDSEAVPSWSKQEQFFLNFLDKGWSEDSTGNLSEEAWLAQEDLWIQTEVYRLIRMANDFVAVFEGKGGSAKDTVSTFRNPYWELGLKWDGGKRLKVTMKNLLDHKQKRDLLKFRVWFGDKIEPDEIAVGGKPVGPRGSKEAEVTSDITLPEDRARKSITKVEQVLTWETAAVKRIDYITVGSMGSTETAHSHRTFTDGLQPLKEKDPNAPPPGLTPPPNAPPGGAPPPVAPPINRRTPGRRTTGPARPIRDQGSNETTKHGLIRNQFWNYLDDNGTPRPAGTPLPQFRRVPVAITLIVDQDHIFRTQAAFNNSKLRFLTTQVLLNRWADTLQPQIPKDGISVGPTTGRRPQSAPQATSPDNMETNFEMVIYGVVTLYDRYPPMVTAAGPVAPPATK